MSKIVSRSKQPLTKTLPTTVEDDGYNPKKALNSGGKLRKIGALSLFVSLLYYYFDLIQFNNMFVSDHSIEIPTCTKYPWKPSEDLISPCSSLKPHELSLIQSSSSAFPGEESLRIAQCATDCCQSENCVAWQYRKDAGCLHGGDLRLGMEKDGPASWCHEHPPLRWKGQFIEKGSGDGRRAMKMCSVDGWNPDEQPGQCFGLGDERKINGERIPDAKSCMEACCKDEKCFAWQFQPYLGCYYNKKMHGCKDVSDPIKLEPFVGRRKVVPDRTYTDARGNLWSQKL